MKLCVNELKNENTKKYWLCDYSKLVEMFGKLEKNDSRGS